MTTVETTRVLAIDPGVTTGVALVDASGDPIENFSDQHPYDRLRRYLDLLDPKVEVVVECAPEWEQHYRFHHEAVKRLVQDSQEATPRQVTWVTPGQWKGSPPALRAVPLRMSAHERDALRMARWRLSTTRRTREGSKPEGNPSRAHEGAT